MEILLNWLNHDVKLSQNIKDIDKQFSNGYLLGELLFKYNQILEFKEKFKDSNSKENIVKNFSQIEPIMSRLAIDVMNSKNGISCQLIRQLKDILEQSYGTLDINVVHNTGKQNKIFPLKKIDFRKSKYEQIQNQIFTKRLYNTIPPQQVQNLDKKLQKYKDVQMQIQQTKENEKKIHELEKEKERIYNREMMISQLKRKIQFTNEWNNNCIQNHQKTLFSSINRINMEKNYNNKCNKQMKQNIIARQNKAEKDFKQQIDEFENNFQEKENKRIQQNQDRGELLDFIKSIQNKECVQNVESFKKQLNSYYKSEDYKKERDRRLRKVIVDQKKQQIKRNFMHTQKSFFDVVNMQSQREKQLEQLIQQNRKYFNIIIDNTELRNKKIEEKREEMTQNQNEYEGLILKQKKQDIDNFVENQNIYYKNQQDEEDLNIYYSKYNQAKQVAENIIESSMNFEQQKQSLNCQTLPINIWNIIFNQNFYSFYEKNQQKYFQNNECSYNCFTKFIYNNVLKKFENIQLNTQNQDKFNYESLTYKVLILGLPYTDNELIQSYITDKLNIETFNIQEILQGLLKSKNKEFYNEFIQQLQAGLELNYSQLNKLLIQNINEKFDDQSIQNQVNLYFEQIKQNEIVARKIHSMNNLNDDNFHQTIPMNFKPDLESKNQNQEQNKNNQDEIQQDQQNQNNQTIKLKNNNQVNKNLRKIKSEIQTKINDKNENLYKEILQKYIEQGLVCLNYPNTIESLQDFEQQINGYCIEDKRNQNDVQSFVSLFNKIYSVDKQKLNNDDQQFMCFQEKLQNKKQKLFFDLIILLENDINLLYQKAKEEKTSIQVVQNKFLHERVFNQNKQMQFIKGFYQHYISNEQIIVLNQNQEFHNLIEQLDEKIRRLKLDKQQQIQNQIEKKLQQNKTFETEKQIIEQIDNDIKSKRYIKQDHLQKLKQNLINDKIQDISHRNFINIIKIVQQFLEQYYINVNKVLKDIQSNKMYFQQNVIKFYKNLKEQYYQDKIINEILFKFVNNYNQFINEHYDIFDQEEVSQELQFRLSNFEIEINITIDNIVSFCQQQEKDFQDSEAIKNYINSLVYNILIISQNEIQKFFDEQKIIQIFQIDNYETKSEDITKKKSQNLDKQNQYMDIFKRDKVNLQTYIDNFMVEIQQSFNDKEILKEKLNQAIEFFIQKLKLNDCNFDIVEQKKDKNQKGQELQQSTDNFQTDEQREILNNTIIRLKYLKEIFLEEYIEMYEQNTKQQQFMKSITQNFRDTLKNQIQKLIVFINGKIQQESIIQNHIYFEGFSIIIDNKALLEQSAKQEHIVTNEILQSDLIQTETLDKIVQNLLNMRNSLQQVPKQKLQLYFQKIILNQGGEIELPQKWLDKDLKLYFKIFEQFKEFEDPNYTQIKPILVNILLENYKVPSIDCIKFYKQFAQKEKNMSYERFMRVKLFFEYDENNEIIRDEFQCKRFEFIKNKLYQIFKKNDYEQMSFGTLVESMSYKIKENLLQENMTFFDLLFKQLNYYINENIFIKTWTNIIQYFLNENQ